MNKKTVFLVRNVAKEKFGGGEIYQIDLAMKLKEFGFCPVVLTNSKELIRKLKSKGIMVLVPPYNNKQNWSGWSNFLLPKYYCFQRRLSKWYDEMILKYKPTVINIQSRDDMIAGTLSARKHNVRIIWTDHADFKNWVLWNVKSKFKNIIGKKIINLSKYTYATVFISKKIEIETKKLISPKEIINSVVVENGVTDEYSRYENVKARKGSFVFVGRIVKEKGISELIEAFRIVAKKHPEIVLKIYGDGPDLKSYSELAGDARNIVFYGATNKPLEVMAECDIFVLPSYQEGLSLSLLDAAMMKKKIIASDVGGNSEIVVDKETGLLVPVKNVSKLAVAMEWMLCNQKKASALAGNARRMYEEKFNFDKIFAEKVLPLYNITKEEE